MTFINIFAIAVALAMDACAVAIATAVNLQKVGLRQCFRLSFHFGLFQALMPILGWFAGLTVRSRIERYDHWAAFGLLAFVGLNMVRGHFQREKEDRTVKDPTKGLTLVILSVATSIDALAVGLSIAIVNISIWFPALIIGLVAGIFTLFGLYVGSRVASARMVSSYAELIGGLVLIAIGFKILYDHGALQLF